MATKGFRQAGHTPSLAAALIHFDISFLCWVLVGALGAYIASDLGLSPMQKGLMVAVPPLGGAGFRLLLGPLSDRMGIKRLGLVTMALTLVPLLWAATMATTFALTTDRLLGAWQQVMGPRGAHTASTVRGAVRRGPETEVAVDLAFADGEGWAKVTFDSDGRVVGLLIG